MMTPTIKIKKVKTEQLVPYSRNAKQHTAEQVDQIANSIDEFGFNNPVLAWHNGSGETEIVAGHGRVMAAKKKGIAELPVIYLDHLTDEQRRAFSLIENKLTLNSEFDTSMMLEELSKITNIDMGAFSYRWVKEAVGEQLPEVDFPREQKFKYKEEYAVIVVCDTSDGQRETLDVLTERGYRCEAVTV